MKTRNIEKVLVPNNFNWVGDGFYVNSFVGGELTRRRMDPFITLDYNAEVDFSPRETPRGVGGHPHKGFETVTIAYKGKVEHHDSRGNHGIIGEGDVQWMTAGAGLMHQEYHEQEFSKTGGPFQMVQLWVNLPAKDKETTPKYQDLMGTEMTKVVLDNDGGYIDVIAGEHNGKKGKGTTFSPIHMYNAYLNKGAQTAFSLPSNFNTVVLVIEGAIKVNGTQEVQRDSLALFENNLGDTFTLEAIDEKTTVLILSGEPLNEPVAHYGPFVMNTEEQLLQAFQDFRDGKFGEL